MSVHELSDAVRAVATLAWPALLAWFLWLFRPQIARLFGRLENLKVPGGEASFRPELDRLEKELPAAEAPSEPLPLVPIPEATEAQSAGEVEGQRRAQDDLVREAAESPKLALMTLNIQLERSILRLSAMSGWARDLPTPRAKLDEIPLPDALKVVVRDFWDVRNKIVHGGDATDGDILRAIDIGRSVLAAVEAIPVERNYVADPSVSLYADPAGATLITDGRGVLLRTIAPDGSESLRIFPTTRTHFVEGMQVSWEWNMGRTWGEAWYLSPITGTFEPAWGGSAEFVGRNLDEIAPP